MNGLLEIREIHTLATKTLNSKVTPIGMAIEAWLGTNEIQILTLVFLHRDPQPRTRQGPHQIRRDNPAILFKKTIQFLAYKRTFKQSLVVMQLIHCCF